MELETKMKTTHKTTRVVRRQHSSPVGAKSDSRLPLTWDKEKKKKKSIKVKKKKKNQSIKKKNQSQKCVMKQNKTESKVV